MKLEKKEGKNLMMIFLQGIIHGTYIYKSEAQHMKWGFSHIFLLENASLREWNLLRATGFCDCI